MAVRGVHNERGPTVLIHACAVVHESGPVNGQPPVELVLEFTLELNGLLFGDLLAVNSSDLYLIAAVTIVVTGFLCYYWRQLLSITVHPELASVEGINVERMELLLMLCLALVVAVGMQVVGVLLITALLIIPAATARKLSRTPEQMALYSIGFGSLAVVMGMTLSATIDSAAGPSIVTSSTLLFLLTQIIPSTE